MSKVEKYIENYTRNCSNEERITVGNNIRYTRHPWLTPDHARAVAEIAREEVIDKAVTWLNNIYITQEPISLDDIEDFKKYMEESV